MSENLSPGPPRGIAQGDIMLSGGAVRRHNLTGQRVGSLRVGEYHPKGTVRNHSVYRCICDCGAECFPSALELAKGRLGRCARCGHRSRACPAADLDAMVWLYEGGATQHEAAAALGWSEAVLHEELHRRGVAVRTSDIARRKLPVNDNFFTDITTDEQAYWVGFIAADGCVMRNQLYVNLAVKDAGHLDRLRLALKPDGALKPVVSHNGLGSISHQVRLEVSSRQIVSDLLRCNVTERKSATCQPWDGPAHLMPAYWRGLLDGDGCWHVRPQSRGRGQHRRVNLVGSEGCTRGFAEFVARVAGGCPQAAKKVPGRNMWSVSVSRLSILHQLIDTLYAGSTVHLERKKAIACSIRETVLTGSCRHADHSGETPRYRPFWNAGKGSWYVSVATGRRKSLGITDPNAREEAEQMAANLMGKPVPLKRQPGNHPYFRAARNTWYVWTVGPTGRPSNHSLGVRGRENRPLAEAALARLDVADHCG